MRLSDAIYLNMSTYRSPFMCQKPNKLSILHIFKHSEVRYLYQLCITEYTYSQDELIDGFKTSYNQFKPSISKKLPEHVGFG